MGGMGSGRPPEWPEESVNILTNLWSQGLSAAVIAAELGKTRNAVIGKAHRLKLSKPSRPKKAAGRRSRARPQHNPSPAKIIASALNFGVPEPFVENPPVEGGISLLDLEGHHCRAIVGNGPDGIARYCGAQKEGRLLTSKGGFFDSAYCQAHGDIFFQRGALIR